MFDELKRAPVSTPSLERTLEMAKERIKSVPPTMTMIDQISADEWTDESVSTWNICAGGLVGDADELDGFDATEAA